MFKRFFKRLRWDAGFDPVAPKPPLPVPFMPSGEKVKTLFDHAASGAPNLLLLQHQSDLLQRMRLQAVREVKALDDMGKTKANARPME